MNEELSPPTAQVPATDGEISRQLVRRKVLRRATSFLALTACVLSASPAVAVRPGDVSTLFPINDEDPSSGIPTPEDKNKNPLEFAYYLQDLIERAEPAIRRGDWQEAIKYYEVLATAVPERAIGFSRLCVAYAKLGQFDLAQGNCGRAIATEGANLYDHVHFVDAALRKPALSDVDLEEIGLSIQHVRAHLAEHPELLPRPARPAAAPEKTAVPAETAVPEKAAAPATREATPSEVPPQGREDIKKDFMQRVERSQQEVREQALTAVPTETMHVPTELEFLSCKLAARIGDSEGLGHCIAALEQLGTDARIVLPFRWTTALLGQRSEESSALLAEAKLLGLPPSAIEKMTAEHDRHFPAKRNWTAWGLIAAAVALFGAAVSWRGQRSKALTARAARAT